jgi:hypothetical protein
MNPAFYAPDQAAHNGQDDDKDQERDKNVD